jgi:hypothetical protein
MTAPTKKKITFAFPSLLVLLAALPGCASTKMHTFTDPDFVGYRCSRLLVAARLPHLDQQAEAEDIFLSKLAPTDLTCTRSVDILPPTRQFSDEEMFAVLAEKNIGAVLAIRETEYYEDQVYVPESSTTSTYGNLSANTYYYGNTASTYGSMNATSYTHKSGGHYVSVPRVRHELELYDVATRKVVWIGGAFTKGNSRAGFKTLVSALASETRRAFERDGLAHRVTAP